MGKIYKLKPAEIEENYDPLNILPQEILDIIFEYLKVKDLLNLSLVSWNWYNMIGQSEWMKRIYLIYKCGDKNEMESLLKSNRQYQNIVVRKSASNRLKRKEMEVKNILIKFASSIKFIDSPFDIDGCCDLPKLRKLGCFELNFGYFYSDGLFSKTEFIEELTLKYRNYDKRYEKFCKKIFASAKNLKVLNTRFIDETVYSFSLREFSYRAYFGKEVIDFLKSQSSTIENLSIRVERDVGDLLPIILTMPNLKKLELKKDNDFAVPGNLPKNATIKVFDINGTTQLLNILPVMTNLQVLKVDYLNANLIKLIPSCSLRKIEYAFVANNVPEIHVLNDKFPDIKFVKIGP